MMCRRKSAFGFHIDAVSLPHGMKKFTAAILLLIYFTVSTGFVINLHYCMDKVASVEVGESHADECGKCGMPLSGDENCCRDEIKVVKLYQDLIPAYSIVFELASLPALITTVHYIITPFENAAQHDNYWSHAPPLISKQDTYLNNRVFRL